MRGSCAKVLQGAAYLTTPPQRHAQGYHTFGNTVVCGGVRRTYRMLKKAHRNRFLKSLAS